MLLPEGVTIDGKTGEVTPSTGRYRKTLSDLSGFFHDTAKLDALIGEKGDRTVYEVIDYRHPGAILVGGARRQVEVSRGP